MSTMAVDQDTRELSGVLARIESLLTCCDPREVWRLGGRELSSALATLSVARHALDVLEVALVREGIGRGLDRDAGYSTHDWMTRAEGARAPQPAAAHTAQVIRLAKASQSLGLVPTDPDDVALTDPGVRGPSAGWGEEPAPADLGDILTVFASGHLSLAKTDQLARFAEQTSPVADPALLAATLGAIVTAARDDDPSPSSACSERIPGITERQLATAITRAGRLVRPARAIERDDTRARAGRGLYYLAGPAGLTGYKLLLDPEGAAILDAAVAALSAPQPDADGPDRRPPARRRADALVEIIQRGVSAPGQAPTTDKAHVVVTIGYAALAEALPTHRDDDGLPLPAALYDPRPTHHAGTTATGQVLAPSVVRRMACDAGIIPMVLSGTGQSLDLGRTKRLFTPGQRLAIWHRDQGCTYPGCTMPPQWCDAHHLTWWSRGGPTDLTNAALLCRRHHTRVHQLDLTATITATTVTWHT